MHIMCTYIYIYIHLYVLPHTHSCHKHHDQVSRIHQIFFVTGNGIICSLLNWFVLLLGAEKRSGSSHGPFDVVIDWESLNTEVIIA